MTLQGPSPGPGWALAQPALPAWGRPRACQGRAGCRVARPAELADRAGGLSQKQRDLGSGLPLVSVHPCWIHTDGQRLVTPLSSSGETLLSAHRHKLDPLSTGRAPGSVTHTHTHIQSLSLTMSPPHTL